MKKLAILTSILALAACGGGSGGGHSGSTTNTNDFVIPTPIDTPNQDKNSINKDYTASAGVGMLNINESRIARYEQAIQTVNAIESQYNDINYNASIQRKASANKSPKTHYADSIDSAYQTMYDIFVNRNFANHTNHSILLALALLDMSQEDIFNLLGWHNGFNLDDKIQEFVAKIRNQDNSINYITNNARHVYEDFGKEFNITLENAKFYHNSDDDNWYTFEIAADGTITHLKEKNGDKYTNNGNGVFENDIKGKRYSFELDNDNYDIDVEIVYEENEVPTDYNVIFADLRNKIKQKYDISDEDIASITNWDENSIINVYDECNSSNGCIESSNANYRERIRIETGSNKLGLKYSDFGLRYEETLFREGDDVLKDPELGDVELTSYTYSEHGGFVGGYEDYIANPESGMRFEGISYVGLTRKQSDAQIDNDNEIREPINKYYTGTSVLTITGTNENNLKQNLVADFTNKGWYKVTVNDIPVNNNGNTLPINERGIDIAFENKTGKEIAPDWQVDPEHHDGKIENLNIKHYGPTSDNATESVGFVQYIEDKVSSGDWTFKADITFGAKKVNE